MYTNLLNIYMQYNMILLFIVKQDCTTCWSEQKQLYSLTS